MSTSASPRFVVLCALIIACASTAKEPRGEGKTSGSMAGQPDVVEPRAGSSAMTSGGVGGTELAMQPLSGQGGDVSDGGVPAAGAGEAPVAVAGANDAGGAAGASDTGGAAGANDVGGAAGVRDAGAGGDGVAVPSCGDTAPAQADPEQVVALAAGSYHNCALRGDGSVKCWGANTAGQLGIGDKKSRGDAAGEMGAELPELDLGSGRHALSLVAGNYHTCARLDDGSVKCWGFGATGALGLGDEEDRGDEPGEMGDALPAVDLGAGRTALQLAAGGTHTCALLDDGSVKCWGANSRGELGQGDELARGNAPEQMGESLASVDFGAGRLARAISAGESHTCAILDDDSLRCWGDNAYGQLGLGDTDARGDDPGEVAAAIVDLGAAGPALLIDAGSNHTCATLKDGTLRCWGRNNVGQLGLGDKISRGDEAGDMGDALESVDLGEHACISALESQYHNCVRFADGLMKCFGYNFDGQLGLNNVMTRGDAANEMGDALPFVQVGAGRTVRAIALAEFHTCALLDDGSVRCWGYNNFGQLGMGDYNDRLGVGDEPPIPLW